MALDPPLEPSSVPPEEPCAVARPGETTCECRHDNICDPCRRRVEKVTTTTPPALVLAISGIAKAIRESREQGKPKEPSVGRWFGQNVFDLLKILGPMLVAGLLGGQIAAAPLEEKAQVQELRIKIQGERIEEQSSLLGAQHEALQEQGSTLFVLTEGRSAVSEVTRQQVAKAALNDLMPDLFTPRAPKVTVQDLEMVGSLATQKLRERAAAKGVALTNVRLPLPMVLDAVQDQVQDQGSGGDQEQIQVQMPTREEVLRREEQIQRQVQMQEEQR